jgi:hypothetical protein
MFNFFKRKKKDPENKPKSLSMSYNPYGRRRDVWDDSPRPVENSVVFGKVPEITEADGITILDFTDDNATDNSPSVDFGDGNFGGAGAGGSWEGSDTESSSD